MKIADKLYAYIWNDFRANNCNTYVVRTDRETCVVDPGHKAFLPRLLRSMEGDGIRESDVKRVLLTHGHPDHMEGAFALAENGARIGIHRAEEAFLKEIGPFFAQMMGLDMPELLFDFYLEEGNLDIGGEPFRVVETPGHSPGSVCLFWEEPGVFFSGDLVFAQGVGRTDFPGGDGEQLKKSIQRCRQFGISRLLPGHGEMLNSREAVAKNFEMIERMYFDYL
jgi:hydroxyacylglutathione hydrolase